MKFLRSMTWDYAIPQADAKAAPQTPELLMDDETFAAFYQRTARPLWAYLARVSGNATLADDLVQESYLRFLGANVELDGDVACRRYLFRIATNLLHDHWRRPSTSALDDVPESKLEAPDRRDDDRIDSRTMLEPSMARMRPLERQLLWLAYVEGSSHREIAEITGLAAVSVRMLLFRARRKLAGFLRQQGVEPRMHS